MRATTFSTCVHMWQCERGERMVEEQGGKERGATVWPSCDGCDAAQWIVVFSVVVLGAYQQPPRGEGVVHARQGRGGDEGLCNG